MEIDPVYQTIEDRNNPDEVERNGAIPGKYKPWLGDGYYFWDGFIENAHWWGKNHIKNIDYMICEASIKCDDEYFLDLYGNIKQMNEFSKTLKLITISLNKQDITVSEAIAYLRKKSKSFKYKVIRAESPDCGSPKDEYKFVNYHKSKLNLIKPIQICSNDTKLINGYHIIYPEYYNQNWLG